MFKGLKVTTQNAWYELEWSQNEFKIRSSTINYMQKEIIGKKVEKPKLMAPLIIYLDKDHKLTTSRVLRIDTLTEL